MMTKVFLAMLVSANAWAAPYPGCAAPTDADFRMVTLVSRQAGNLNQPLKMDFDMSTQGNVDIYFVEIEGNVRKYDAVTKAVTTLGKIDVHHQDEYGMMGI